MTGENVVNGGWRAGHRGATKPSPSRPAIKVARTLEDLMQVTAIRAAVFMSDQACPYEEEFDGNDLCSTHLIGMVGREPAACIRARFFADFVKLERLAVRQEYRRSRLAFQMVQAGIELARKKGFRRIYGHAQDRLVDFWARFGARPLGPDRKLVFSDFSYTEMVIELEPHPDPITVDSDPYVIIRPEGEWGAPGVLEASAARAPTSPLHGRVEEKSAA
ncbi:MAG: GNAT family N-acetyltransferase [Bauldia sp.]